MKKIILLILVFISISVYSQETSLVNDLSKKIDSLNSLIAKNNQQIKNLQSHNEGFVKEIKTIQIKIDSLTIKNESKFLYSKGHAIFYKDIDLSERILNIDKDEKVAILDYLGNNKYKILYNGLTGYVLKYGFITEEEQLKKGQAQEQLKRDQAKEQQLQDQAKIKRERDLIKKYGSHYGKMISEGRFAVGMTKDMLIESIGRPNDINRTVGSWGVHEQWVYDIYDLYIYFENGKVTSFQD